MKKRAGRKTQSGVGKNARRGSRYGVNGNGVRRSPLVLVVIAALVVGTILFASADALHDNGLRMHGETTVGSPTGEFGAETQRTPSGLQVTYFVEYRYTVDGVDYTGTGSTGYTRDERPQTINTTRTATVFFDAENRRDSYIPDEKQN